MDIQKTFLQKFFHQLVHFFENPRIFSINGAYFENFFQKKIFSLSKQISLQWVYVAMKSMIKIVRLESGALVRLTLYESDRFYIEVAYRNHVYLEESTNGDFKAFYGALSVGNDFFRTNAIEEIAENFAAMAKELQKENSVKHE